MRLLLCGMFNINKELAHACSIEINRRKWFVRTKTEKSPPDLSSPLASLKQEEKEAHDGYGHEVVGEPYQSNPTMMDYYTHKSDIQRRLNKKIQKNAQRHRE